MLSLCFVRFASFCWNLPDNDLVARGNAMIYATEHPNLDGNLESNFSDHFISLFRDSAEPSTSALAYVYAIISSFSYRNNFKGALFRGADPENPIRIPIFEDEALRKLIAEQGLELAKFENFDEPIAPSQSIDVQLTPDFEELELCGFTIGSDDSSIVLKGANEEITLSNIEPEVIITRISGYNVLEKWLRERKFSYLKRTFRQKDLRQLLELITRLDQQIRLIKTIDQLFDEGLNKDQYIKLN